MTGKKETLTVFTHKNVWKKSWRVLVRGGP